jgi:hypothetical protein
MGKQARDRTLFLVSFSESTGLALDACKWGPRRYWRRDTMGCLENKARKRSSNMEPKRSQLSRFSAASAQYFSEELAGVRVMLRYFRSTSVK